MLVIRKTSVGMKQGVSISSLIIFFSEQNGDTVFHCPTTICPEVHHSQCGMAANVVAILTCDVPNVVSVHLGPTGSTACEIQGFI